MASQRAVQRLHKLIWVLIYGGLLTLVLGIATARTQGPLGLVLQVVGGGLTAVGVLLIFVRARMRVEES